MFAIPYRVGPSRIAGAGRGIFLLEKAASGAVIVAPDAIARTYRWDDIVRLGETDRAVESSVRWFEDHFTISPDWPDECFVNHSFEPTGLWHLGFVFAARELPADTELTIDYQYLLHEDFQDGFIDGVSGRRVSGLPWRENLRASTAALLKLLG
jgi:hypothetical protein